uniref:cation diffusion facilitator family transporter n=1 Tax=Methylobacillus arboreus TaxID=755170 RepID=UPI001E4D7703|nr:cation diffusion facilitator family transporter [Methylobacillus arboreus]
MKIALAINLSMFFVEGVAGWFANSTSLMADALDMMGDATVYGMSLYVLSKTSRQQAQASLLKALFMMGFGLFVLSDAIYKTAVDSMPDAATMGIVGTLALVSNLICFILLYTHRQDDINMRSTWLCSRNDLIANVSVIIAAGLSYYLASKWPDILIGLVIALLFLRSAMQIATEAREIIKHPPKQASPVLVPIKIRK